MKTPSKVTLSLFAAGMLSVATGHSATIVADFNFSGGSLASTVGSSSLSVVSTLGSIAYTDNVTINAVIPPGINVANTVNTATITGAANNGAANYTGFQWNTTDLAGSTSNYSVAMLVNVTQTAGWGVLFGTSGLTSQNTLLVNGGTPGLTSNNSVTFGSSGALSSNQWRQLVLTYDGSTVSYYYETSLGSSTVSTISSANWAASGNGSNPFTFFANTNGTLTDNNINATVGRIQVYSGVLTLTEVNALDLSAATIPEPTALSLAALTGCVALLRRRRL